MRRLVVLATLAVCLLRPAGARADQAVAMQTNQFAPRELTVTTGETVVWTNRDSVGHSVTADDGAFDSSPACGSAAGGCLKKGATFSHSFGQPGRFSYHCRIHGAGGGQGMAGTVTVTG